jgi:hypothetical protein
LPLTVLGLRPAAQQQLDLLVTTDEWCCGCAEGLEPTLDRAQSHHLIGLQWRGKALRLDAAEIVVLEQSGTNVGSSIANVANTACSLSRSASIAISMSRGARVSGTPISASRRVLRGWQPR